MTPTPPEPPMDPHISWFVVNIYLKGMSKARKIFSIKIRYQVAPDDWRDTAVRNCSFSSHLPCNKVVKLSFCFGESSQILWTLRQCTWFFKCIWKWWIPISIEQGLAICFVRRPFKKKVDLRATHFIKRELKIRYFTLNITNLFRKKTDKKLQRAGFGPRVVLCQPLA